MNTNLTAKLTYPYFRLGAALLVAILLAAAAIGAERAAAAPAQPLELDLVGRTPIPGSANQAEIAAFDPDTDRVFVTNSDENDLDVFDFSDPANPVPLGSIDLDPFGGSDADDFGPTSVDVHDGIVAVALQGETPQAIGTVQFFTTDGVRIDEVGAGSLPDMVTFTPDGSYLLVANEGEPSDDGIFDPEGSVTVIDMRGGFDDLIVRQASFHGVPLRGPVRFYTPGSTAPQDLEPEYITTHGDTAYVSVQEANAIAILDIPTGEFELVRSLGFKDHGAAGNGLDTSDQGPAIGIQTWPNLFGMYEPDAIGSYTLPVKKKVRCKKGPNKGKLKCRKTVRRTFVATANEGDTRDFSFFSEESRVNALDLDPTAFPAGSELNTALGRLTVTTTRGDTDGDGDYDKLFVPGGRSMSIVDATGKLVYDTGDELEQIAASIDAANFNKDNSAGSAIDNRSDNKGPEPEALAIGKVGGHTYAFVGAERSGGIYAFDLSAATGEARFAGYLNTRTDDLGPEGAKFLPASESPNGEPMLLITYEISSTVAAYGLAVTP